MAIDLGLILIGRQLIGQQILVRGLQLEMLGVTHHQRMTVHRNQLRIQSHMRLKVIIKILYTDWLIKLLQK
jgi:hypothetical protein